MSNNNITIPATSQNPAQAQNWALIPTYDTDAMARRVNELIEDDGKRVAFSEKSGISIDKFSKARVLALWHELIEEAR